MNSYMEGPGRDLPATGRSKLIPAKENANLVSPLNPLQGTAVIIKLAILYRYKLVNI